MRCCDGPAHGFEFRAGALQVIMEDERYEFLGERIDHVDGRVDDMDTRITALEGADDTKKSRALEWIVIILVLVETIFTVLMFLSHG